MYECIMYICGIIAVSFLNGPAQRGVMTARVKACSCRFDRSYLIA